MGGATIFGALSVGASGDISYGGNTTGYGGTGGAIADNTVIIENITLRGGASGDGSYSAMAHIGAAIESTSNMTSYQLFLKTFMSTRQS